MRRLPLHAVGTTGAADGDVPTYDAAADRLVYAAPTGGTGGGGGAAPNFLQLRKSVPQSLARLAWQVITWDVEDYDTLGLHSNTTNPSRITATVSGLYTFNTGILMAASTAGSRILGFRKNGTNLLGRVSQTPTPGGYTDIEANRTIPLVAGDYVEVIAYHEAASAIDAVASTFGGEAGCFITARRVSDLPA